MITADNGQEAVRRFQENRVDLVLMDVIMPIMNGMESYRIIKERIPDVRILFTSGYSAEILGRETIVAEGVRLLQKPVLPDTLLKAVREVLGAAR